jgi:iron complex outermembrane recepter protein
MKKNRDQGLREPKRQAVPGAELTSARSLLAMAVSAALCASPPGHAQQATENDLTLEEIVVTASLRKGNMQDLPQSITVLTSEDIEKAGYKEMGDYIRDLPSVTLAQQMPGRNNIVFRGVSTDSEDFYTDAQAGVYLDDQPITTNATQVSPYLVDIERVESLPGPQGTLFGSSAETGVLRIITNKPDPSGFSGQFSATGFATQGGAGSYEVDGHLNIPLIDNKLTARVVGFYSEEGGWIDNVYGTDLAQDNNNAAAVKSNSNKWTVEGMRLAALWTVNDKANVLFNLTTQNDTTKGDWNSDPYLGDAKITRFIENSRHDNWYQAAMTVTADLGFAELKSATAYFDRHMTYTQDNMTYEQYKIKVNGSDYSVWGSHTQNGTPAYNQYNTRINSTGKFTTSTTFNDQWQYRFSQELRLTSKGDSPLQWLGGLFYERVHDNWWYGTQNLQFLNTTGWLAVSNPNGTACYYQSLGYNVQCPLPPTTIVYGDRFDRVVKQIAAFGEVSYKLNDHWTVIGGGRWFRYDRDIDQEYQLPLGIPAALGTTASGKSSGSENATLGKFSIQYRFNPDVMTYFLFSQGYRLGGFNSERAAASGAVPAQYQPDKLNNFEVGLKSQWFDHRLTLNASLFLMKWTDIQLNSNTSGAANGNGAWWKRGTINGGSAENSGLELSGAARVTKQWSLDFSMMAANPHLTDPVVYPNGETIPEGTQMVGAPDFKASAGVEYAFDWKPAGGDLWARLDYSYQSSIYQSLYYASAAYQNAQNAVAYPGDPSYQIPPNWGRIEPWRFAKFQVGASLPNKLDLTLTVNNVFNSKGANWVTTSEGWYARQFGDPRYQNMQAQFRPQSIGLTLRKSF